ncbi:hypothetical protein GC194_11145 [bacterium]|nr:hypothetical protein [bacterium]
MKYFYTTVLICFVWSGCSTTQDNCPYTQYNGTANCNSGYYPVSSAGCCPEGTPYYCSDDNSCYADCDYANSNCAASIVRANVNGNTGGSGGNSGGSGGCDYSMSGSWTRYNSSYGCDGLKVSFSGSSGRVTSAPSDCCFNVGDEIWTNYDDQNCTIDIMVLNGNTCEFLRYDTYSIYFDSKNEISISSTHYKR